SLNWNIDTGEVVNKPVCAGRKRNPQPGIQVAIKSIVIVSLRSTIKNILSIDQSSDPIRNILKAKAVMTPNDGGLLLTSRADAFLKRKSVSTLPHNSRSNADRFDQFWQVQEHHVAVTFA